MDASCALQVRLPSAAELAASVLDNGEKDEDDNREEAEEEEEEAPTTTEDLLEVTLRRPRSSRPSILGREAARRREGKSGGMVVVGQNFAPREGAVERRCREREVPFLGISLDPASSR